MGSRIQPGARIDEDLYERFKNHVRERFGDRRGAVGKEMERALREYMESGDGGDPIARIEDDVASTKAAVADLVMRIDGAERDVSNVEVDGGSGGTLSNTRSHTHTPTRPTGHDVTPDVDDDPDPPNAKAPKSDKVEYVFDSMVSGDGLIVHPKALRNRIDGVWGFGDRATDDLIDLLYNRYHAKPVRETDGEPWYVALARTETAREDVVDEWAQSQDGDYQFVNPTTTNRDDWPV